jgi:hypothetical protein
MVERAQRDLRSTSTLRGRWHETGGKIRVTLTHKALQSFRDELDRLGQKRLIPIIVIPTLFVMVWGVECVQKYVGRNLDPQFWAFIALTVTIYGGFEIFRLRPHLRRFHRGTQGEHKVADVLDQLRAKGFVPIHHLPGEGFHVDHVVVGPTGVYALETKTRVGSGTIEYRDNSALIFGGRISDSRPLSQARSSAGAVHAHLQQHFGENYSVKPLLVFVGNWRVEREAGDFDVDVVTADRLEKYFDRQQPELTSGEIEKISSHLERSARS